jgi:hypothetical protein
VATYPEVPLMYLDRNEIKHFHVRTRASSVQADPDADI